jgi:hypothetical protein
MSGNWFTSMFSSESREGATVEAPVLNSTKIGAILIGIPAAIAAIYDGAGGDEGFFGKLTNGQKLLFWLILFGAVVILIAADMWARAYTTARSIAATRRDPVVIFSDPVRLEWRHKQDGKEQAEQANALAMRSTEGNVEYLIATTGTEAKATWVSPRSVTILGPD